MPNTVVGAYSPLECCPRHCFAKHLHPRLTNCQALLPLSELFSAPSTVPWHHCKFSRKLKPSKGQRLHWLSPAGLTVVIRGTQEAIYHEVRPPSTITYYRTLLVPKFGSGQRLLCKHEDLIASFLQMNLGIWCLSPCRECQSPRFSPWPAPLLTSNVSSSITSLEKPSLLCSTTVPCLSPSQTSELIKGYSNWCLSHGRNRIELVHLYPKQRKFLAHTNRWTVTICWKNKKLLYQVCMTTYMYKYRKMGEYLVENNQMLRVLKMIQ